MLNVISLPGGPVRKKCDYEGVFPNFDKMRRGVKYMEFWIKPQNPPLGKGLLPEILAPECGVPLKLECSHTIEV